jgi:hypothetical protein
MGISVITPNILAQIHQKKAAIGINKLAAYREKKNFQFLYRGYTFWDMAILGEDKSYWDIVIAGEDKSSKLTCYYKDRRIYVVGFEEIIQGSH